MRDEPMQDDRGTGARRMERTTGRAGQLAGLCMTGVLLLAGCQGSGGAGARDSAAAATGTSDSAGLVAPMQNDMGSEAVQQTGASSPIAAPVGIDTAADTVTRGTALKSTEQPMQTPGERPAERRP